MNLQLLRKRFAHHSRRRHTLMMAAALALPALVGCGSGIIEREPVKFTIEDWTYKGAPGQKVVSDHYEIMTTCQRKPFVSALPIFMETCYEEYRKVLPSNTQPIGRMPAYLFQRRREWERFTNDFTGPRAPTYRRIRRGGYSERGITVSFYTTQSATLSILAHEGLHQYLEATGRSQIPAWINEGLACYFEAFELDSRNRPSFVPLNNTLRRPSMREALSTETLIPLKEILGTHAGEAVHRESSHVRSYYAQEWSLVLFLLDSPATNRYAPGFKQLLEELGTENMNRKANAYLAADTEGKLSRGEAIFKAYITEDLEAFESDYRAYLHKILDLGPF